MSDTRQTSVISDYDRTHVNEILSGYGTWFGAKLLRLMQGADPENYAKIKNAWPEAAEAYEDWVNGKGYYDPSRDN